MAKRIDSLNLGAHNLNRTYTKSENGITNFTYDVTRHLKVELLVLIESSKREQDPTKELSLVNMLRYDLDSMTPDAIYQVEALTIKYNIQPIYYIISDNSSAVGITMELIRKIDHESTILAFAETSYSVYNAYYITRINQHEFKLREICMFCHAGEDVVITVNKWERKKGFTSDLRKARSFKGQFFGKIISYSCRVEMLFRKQKKWLEVMENDLNFTTEFVQSSMIKTRNKNEEIFNGCGIVADHAKYQNHDFAFPYMVAGMKIYSMKPKKGLTWYAFIKAYQYPCWILVIGSIPVCGLTIYALYKFDKTAPNMSLSYCVWDIVRVYCWDSITLKNRPAKVCTLLTIIMLGTLVFISDYLGEVTSFMTAKSDLWKPMDTFEQLRNSSMKYLVRKGGYEELLFQNDSIMRSKMKYVSEDLENGRFGNILEKILTTVMENPREYVIIAGNVDTFIERYYIDLNGIHDFHISKESYSLSYLSIFLKKGSLYWEEFNLRMMKMWESGIIQNFHDIDKFENKRHGLKKARKENKQPPPLFEPLTLADMTGGFFLLGSGFVVCLTVLILEHVIPEEWIEEYKRFMADWDGPENTAALANDQVNDSPTEEGEALKKKISCQQRCEINYKEN